MANSFSLLQLPKKRQLQVLRYMDGRSLLFLSLLSRKTKELVRSLQLRYPAFDITIDHRRIVFMINGLRLRLDFYEEPEENMNSLEKPKKVWTSIADAWINHFTPQIKTEFLNPLELEEWLDHINYIFNSKRAASICFKHGSERFDMKAIKEKLGKVDVLSIRHDERQSPTQLAKIVDEFFPIVDNFSLIRNPFQQGDSSFQRMLIQNSDNIGLHLFFGFEGFTLNDLLICNSAEIHFSPVQDFLGINRFLKLWMKGANPRLRRLSFLQRSHLIPDEILKGVRISRRIPVEEDVFYNNRVYSRGNYDEERFAVDIHRFDGVRGTVVLKKGTFKLFVSDF